MRLGIIGAGNIGATLATLAVSAGHDVSVANSRGPESLADLADRLHAVAPPEVSIEAGTVAEAAKSADVVILAIPFGRYPELPEELGTGVAVVDATNYYTERDGHFPDIEEHRRSSSQLIQEHLTGARVVKAFNSMRWEHLRDLGSPEGAPDRYGIPVSADDADAKGTVFELVNSLGFDPVDAGGLDEGGRKHQPGTPIYTADLRADELAAKLADASTPPGPPSV
ncbi:MAG TPA: NADPH-dependent F420 reductase [Micromonosporaceae bacterium]|nr:NADPH-dependent F420 reductase [Micromonosporaceae bacterium]